MHVLYNCYVIADVGKIYPRPISYIVHLVHVCLYGPNLAS